MTLIEDLSFTWRGKITLLIINETLCKNIAYYRKERQLTQADLAAITGILPKNLSDIEKGHEQIKARTLKVLALIC